jgi:hypothetical protein
MTYNYLPVLVMTECPTSLLGARHLQTLGAITNFIPPIGDAIKLFLINLNIDTQAF